MPQQCKKLYWSRPIKLLRVQTSGALILITKKAGTSQEQTSGLNHEHQCILNGGKFSPPLFGLNRMIAVGTMLRQNEDEWKFPMKISTRFHSQNKQGKSDCLIFPAWSVDETWWSISMENFSSTSFWQRVVPTAPFKDWYFRNKTAWKWRWKECYIIVDINFFQ